VPIAESDYRRVGLHGTVFPTTYNGRVRKLVQFEIRNNNDDLPEVIILTFDQ